MLRRSYLYVVRKVALGSLAGQHPAGSDLNAVRKLFALVLLLVLGDLLVCILVLRVQVLEDLLYLVLFGDFELPHLVVLLHVLHQALDDEGAVLVVTVVDVDVRGLGNLLDEDVSCYGEDEAEAEVWVEFFLLESGIQQLVLSGQREHVLLGEWSLAMDLINMYLALLTLFFNVSLEFLFVHHAPEGFLNFLAGLHDLPFDEAIVHTPILLDFLKDRVLFVNTMQISIFNVSESALPITIHTLARLDLFLLNINYLSYVKYVIDACLHVSY